MKYLLDTNIWLELLLNQENADDVSLFLDKTSSDLIVISDFSLHSISIILCKLKMPEIFTMFVNDLFKTAAISQVVLCPHELIEIPEVIRLYNLNFDDTYQYLVAKNNQLELITFDNDFKRAGIITKKPSEII